MTEISKRITKSMPPSALSGFSFIPERRDQNELTYFGNQKKEVSVLLYDQVFKVHEGYNNKIHRDDREHSNNQGLNVNAEERARIVPVLSSSIYGKRPALESTNRSFVRIARVQTEFYRRNGITNYLEEDQE
ncbi:cilia- and flagella-associated protein 90 [Stegostoma tigrinum]|uniref:cilia- and flagella-associated protein 90 n=1 Tax=Stegostoma tigrinum TaxID=3053191 RepID=UPI00202B8600|nr:cilia- and flagella-associated protein 90 [Stegostoma tigrinum]